MAIETEKCLVDHIGSCTGCGVLNIILEKGKGEDPLERVRLVKRVRETLCTDENKMTIPATTITRQSIW